MPKLPLEGFRIIDHGVVYAGTAATTLLADMGAEVIRVESIGRFPAMTRGFAARPPEGLEAYPGYADGDPGKRPWDRWFQFHAIQRNKLGLALELSRPEGIAVYKRLVAASDVVVENFSQGTMDRLGIGYPVLKETKPDIIMISASGLGAEGPYKGYSTFGSNLDAFSGMMALRGYPDSDISQRDPSPVWSDNTSTSTIAFAALVALHYRQKTGRGQYIDLSQAEGFLPNMGETILDYTSSGRVPKAIGNRDPVFAPQGCYRCRGEDRWVTLSITSDDDWQSLCSVIGDATLADDARFARVEGRRANHDELDRRIEEWTVRHEHWEVMRQLQAASVAAGPVLGAADIYRDPHLEARGFFADLDHPEVGRRRYPGMFFKYSKTPATFRILANSLGEHNDYVLGEILGLSKDEIAELARNNVIGTEYLPGV